MAGEDADDRGIGVEPSLGHQAAHAGDAGRRCGLAEDPLQLDDHALRLEDLVVGDRLDQAARLVARR